MFEQRRQFGTVTLYRAEKSEKESVFFFSSSRFLVRNTFSWFLARDKIQAYLNYKNEKIQATKLNVFR